MASRPATKRRATTKRRRSERVLERRPRKVPTNLSLRPDLVQRAKTLGLNISEMVETALENAIREAEQARWLAENEEAIDYYNAFVKEHGVFGEEFRQF